MKVVDFKKSDLEICSKLYVGVFNDAPWHDAWDERSAYNRLSEIYHTPGFSGWIIIEDDQVIGAVLGNLESWYEGYMYNLKEMFIRSDQKGKGIGSMLMKTVEEALRQRDVTSINLFTCRGDMTEHFYSKNGFVVEEDMIMMSKVL